MNKRGTGAIFCLIGSLLFDARYITAAIFMSNVSSWDSMLLAEGLEYQGYACRNLSQKFRELLQCFFQLY